MKQQNTMSLLKTARLQKSWTPEFVSKKVGVSLNTYIRWESGMQTPRHTSLRALCSIFEMSPAELGFEELVTSKKSFLDNIASRQRKVSTDQDDDVPRLEGNNLTETLELWKMGISSCWQLYMIG